MKSSKPWQPTIKVKHSSMSNDNPIPAEPVWTILRTLQWTTDYLNKRGIDNSRLDAEILLAHALGRQRIDLYLHHDQPLLAEELGRFKPLIQRRAKREPVAYITGVKEFWSLKFTVTPDVLIPRPETEGLVESALACCHEQDAIEVLELGVGSGIISVTLAHERTQWKFWASDLSTRAIAVARHNARNVLRSEDRIKFWVGRWFDGIGDQGCSFDLIVSNPPYVSREELIHLEPDVSQYEPVLALDGGPDGLASVALIVDSAHRHMKPGGWLLLEIGCDQGPAVKALARSCGAYDRLDIKKDYAGLDRIVALRKNKASALPAG